MSTAPLLPPIDSSTLFVKEEEQAISMMMIQRTSSSNIIMRTNSSHEEERLLESSKSLASDTSSKSGSRLLQRSNSSRSLVGDDSSREEEEKQEPESPKSSSNDNNNLKLGLLVLLVVQGSSAILTGRYTRSSVPEEELYEISHLVFVIECVKFVASMVAEYLTSPSFLESLHQHLIQNPAGCCKVLVPAVLYVIQNSLVYIALSNLTAPVFISLQQGKLIATALVSVAMLNRTYSVKQWICLCVLAMGVAIVALDERKDKPQDLGAVEIDENPPLIKSGGVFSHGPGVDAAETSESAEQFFVVGLLAVTGACFSSAFAGVYFEKVLAPEKAANPRETKKLAGDEESGGEISTADNKPPPQPSLWIRNMQLAFFSIIFSYLQGMYDAKAALELAKLNLGNEEEEEVDQKSFLYGFTNYVWLLVVLQAGGGLLVAAVMKYADNVLKGLAMGVSVVVASVVSTLIFDVQLSGQFTLGAAIIFASVYCFSNDIPCSSSCNKPREECQTTNEAIKECSSKTNEAFAFTGNKFTGTMAILGLASASALYFSYFNLLSLRKPE